MDKIDVIKRWAHDRWCVEVHATTGGDHFVAFIYWENDRWIDPTKEYQEVLDGVPGASTPVVKYEAETDQLTFQCVRKRAFTVDRALVAPLLSVKLGLRMPTDLGAKPAKRSG